MDSNNFMAYLELDDKEAERLAEQISDICSLIGQACQSVHNHDSHEEKP